jgi:hypothetical protein
MDRSHLWELNENTFARFDAKLDQFFAENRASFAADLAGVESRLTRLTVTLWMVTMLDLAGLYIAVLRPK